LKPLLIPTSLALTTTIMVAFLVYANTASPPLPKNAQADRILVYKSERKLALMNHGKILKTYRISLGKNPEGAKEIEGDGKTPEGTYKIDYRNPKSQFHLALHISYPNSANIALAKKRHATPGGLIMIHGHNKAVGILGRFTKLVDWTKGCIAVTNQEIEEIWRAVPDGTPIEIRP
jgi:murein L,D-transpeptidase YafK